MDENMTNPGSEGLRTNPSSEKIDRREGVEPLGENPETQEKRMRQRLSDAFETLFNARMGGGYAERGEEALSGDAASIYVLVSTKNEEGKEIPRLVKIGWGEFSRETFESDKYPAFRNFPFDIHCVSQSDSFLADDKLRQEMTDNPIKFLSEHSLFVATAGKVQKAERVDSRTRRLNKDIRAIPYDELLRTVRNQIIKIHSTQEEFAKFLRGLPDDPVELGGYVGDLERGVEWMSSRELQFADEGTRARVRERYLMHTFWGMGVETEGAAVGDRKAMESVLALKKQFDFATNSFN